MIRPATDADWPAVDRMLSHFAKVRGEEYHPATAQMTYLRAVRHEFARIADDDGPVGVMLASLGPSWCSTQLLSQERVVWVEPGARGKWLHAFVDEYREWLGRVGARGAIACPDDRLARALKRRGHRPLETIYEVT